MQPPPNPPLPAANPPPQPPVHRRPPEYNNPPVEDPYANRRPDPYANRPVSPAPVVHGARNNRFAIPPPPDVRDAQGQPIGAGDYDYGVGGRHDRQEALQQHYDQTLDYAVLDGEDRLGQLQAAMQRRAQSQARAAQQERQAADRRHRQQQHQLREQTNRERGRQGGRRGLFGTGKIAKRESPGALAERLRRQRAAADPEFARQEAERLQREADYYAERQREWGMRYGNNYNGGGCGGEARNPFGGRRDPGGEGGGAPPLV